MSEWRLITAKKTSQCEVCKRKVPTGEPIYWSRARSTIRCEADKPIDINDGVGSVVGVAGASALKQYKSKAEWDEDAINKKFPKIGRVINLFNDDPQSTMAWKQGAVGEEAVGEFLAAFAEKNGCVLLNDRRIRGSKANIDHILVTDKAVFVIDAKNYRGLVSVEYESFFSKKEILKIDGKDRTKLVLGVQKQVSLVREALSDEIRSPESIQGVLAFFAADWPLISPPKQILDVKINGRKGLADVIQKQSKLEDLNIKRIANILIKAFPAA